MSKEKKGPGQIHKDVVLKEHLIYSNDRRGGDFFIIDGKRVHESDLPKEVKNDA